MSYFVTLKRNSDGEVRVHEEKQEWTFVSLFSNEISDSYFWWTEGNMACDCNRALCFHKDAPDDWNFPCGDTEYSLVEIKLADGTVVYPVRGGK